MSTQTTKWILELVDKVTAPMKGVTGSVGGGVEAFKKFEFDGTKALDAVGSKIPGIGNAMEMLVNPYALAAAGAAAVVAVGYKATDWALDWQAGLAKINVTAQLTQKELSGLSGELLDIGKQNVAPIEQIPESFNKIISAGLDVKTSLDVLDPSLKAAKAGFNDVGETAKAAVAVMNSSGEDINKVYDILFATLNKGNAEFGDVAQYLPKLIPMARNAGFALNETAGAWAYLTAQGQTSERATTLAQNAMKALADPDRIKAFRQMGINLFDSTGKIKPLVTIIDDLSKKTQGLSDLSRAKFFGKLGLDAEASSFFATATQDAQKFRETIDFTVNSQGQLNEAYKNSMTPLDSWHQITNLIKGNMIELGMKVLPIINKFGQGVLDVINYFKNLYNESVLFRDFMSYLGTGLKVTWELVIAPIRMVWNLITQVGGAMYDYIKMFPGMSGGFENMYLRIKPVLLYIKDLFGQVASIAYKVVTLDFKGAVGAVQNFKMPDMKDIQARVTASAANHKKSDVDLGKSVVTTGNAATKNIDFGSSGKGTGLSGSGVGGVKTINQKIEIKNYFTVSEGSNVDTIAEKVIRAINDRLRDSTVALQF